MENWLKGKKTYIVAIVSLVGAVAAWANGYLDVQEGGILAVFVSLAMTLRGAIGKAETPVKGK